jgi:hypothetical protein
MRLAFAGLLNSYLLHSHLKMRKWALEAPTNRVASLPGVPSTGSRAAGIQDQLSFYALLFLFVLIALYHYL